MKLSRPFSMRSKRLSNCQADIEIGDTATGQRRAEASCSRQVRVIDLARPRPRAAGQDVVFTSAVPSGGRLETATTGLHRFSVSDDAIVATVTYGDHDASRM